MNHRAATLTVLLTMFGVAGCATTGTPPRVETPAPPASVEDLDRFAEVLNRYALIEEGDPKRKAYRAVLLDFLITHMNESLAEDRRREALSALEHIVGLYTPTELRHSGRHPAIVDAAHELYRAAARRGAEQPAFLALATEQHFGSPAVRKTTLERWETLEDWIVRNSSFATEPLLRHEELERSLERIAAVFPSPFVVERLSDLYLARYAAAGKATKFGEVGTAARRRAEVTGYLLVRLYLRADDLEGAIATLEAVDLDLPTRKLRDLVVQAQAPSRSARPLLMLAEQFMPMEDGEREIPPVFHTQGWGIVHNLARRAVRQHPDDPFARLLLAQAVTQEGLIDAAIVHLEHAVALKEDMFEAWQHLALLKQDSLERLASHEPRAAAARLDEFEDFHRRAAELWQDRPIEPGLAQAYFTVAEGLYHAGAVEKAQRLLQRSLSIQPEPASLDLLGTIALKQGRLQQARARYRALAELPHGKDLARLHWGARALQQLAEVARHEGEPQQAKQYRQEALHQLNQLLANSELSPADQAQRLVDRGELLFLLGERALGMQDFGRAGKVAPGHPTVYADPLLFLVSGGHYPQARRIYQQAMGQKDLPPDLKLYFTLWINELALREQDQADPDAADYLASFSGDRWPELLAEHAQGQANYEELLQRAEGRGERAEAHFYEALRRWRLGDQQGAKALLEQVLASEMLSFFEYDMAQAYLAPGSRLSSDASRPRAAHAQP